MAFFDTASETLIGSAFAEGRVVFLAGPRRCGLTHWTLKSFQSPKGETGFALKIDLADNTTVEELRVAIKRCFDLQDAPTHPRDLQVLLSESNDRETFLFLNAHCAAPDTLDWLVRALLDGMAGGTGRRRRFVVEGAVDFEDVVDRSFDGGCPSAPLIEYVAARTPWRVLIDVELVCAARGKHRHPALVPWVADLTGGDLGLVADLLARIPDTEILENADLEAACEKVIRGSVCAIEIAAASKRAEGSDLANRVVAGATLAGVPPAVLRSGDLKNLYLSGIADYDSILRGYRARAPLVRRIVARALGLRLDGMNGQSEEEIHSRSSYLLWQIAHVELSLRSKVRSLECLELAAATRTVTQWSGLGDQIKREMIRRNPGCSSVIGTLAEVTKEILPEREAILQAVQRRLGRTGESMTDELVLAGLSFRELLEVASAAGVVHDRDRDAITAIGATRNNLAHFRPISYDEMHNVVRDIRQVLRSLWGEGTAET